jgi:hypothetical protein
MAVKDGKIRLLDASVFIALMPGIPDAVRALLWSLGNKSTP